MTTTEIEVLKIANDTEPRALGGAIAHIVRAGRRPELHAVGAGAINQAVKAIALARGFLATTGQEIACMPSFMDIEIAGEDRTAIRLMVEVLNR